MAAGFCLLAVYIRDARSQGGSTGLDRRVIDAVRSLESPEATSLMKAVTRMGDSISVMVIALILLLVLALLRYRIELLLYMTVVGGSGLLNLALKQLVRRSRPAGERLVEATGFSFPSGHSMAAFTLYGIAAYLIWKHIDRREGRLLLAIASALIVLAIGASRVYLGVHYPTDVLGAYLAGGAWLAAAIGSFRCWQAARR